MFAIIRKSEGGRTWYQSKNVGEITRVRANVWNTTDRAAADKLAADVGVVVVSSF